MLKLIKLAMLVFTAIVGLAMCTVIVRTPAINHDQSHSEQQP
jgi:hypothetical protein